MKKIYYGEEPIPKSKDKLLDIAFFSLLVLMLTGGLLAITIRAFSYKAEPLPLASKSHGKCFGCGAETLVKIYEGKGEDNAN